MPTRRKKTLTRRKFLEGTGASAVMMTAASHLEAAASSVSAASAIGPMPGGKTGQIGIVGGNSGSHFQWHLDPNCKVVSYCYLRVDRLKSLVKSYGPATTYENFRESLQHPDLDAV